MRCACGRRHGYGHPAGKAPDAPEFSKYLGRCICRPGENNAHCDHACGACGSHKHGRDDCPRDQEVRRQMAEADLQRAIAAKFVKRDDESYNVVRQPSATSR